jgi:CBS domain-containing protein
MNASQIMTSPVITVNPHTAVRHIAALLLRHRISALPVLKYRQLVGIVSEADLLHRHEIGTQATARSRGWLRRLLSAEESATDYVRSHATRARDIMTRDVACVAPATPIAEIATLLERRGIKRAPVLEGEALVGIVSRCDLVRALAARAGGIPAGEASDAAILASLSKELERHGWWRSTTSQVVVSDGVVEYFGMFGSPEEKRAARVAAENVPGVRAVTDHRIPLAAMAWSL